MGINQERSQDLRRGGDDTLKVKRKIPLVVVVFVIGKRTETWRPRERSSKRNTEREGEVPGGTGLTWIREKNVGTRTNQSKKRENKTASDQRQNKGQRESRCQMENVRETERGNERHRKRTEKTQILLQKYKKEVYKSSTTTYCNVSNNLSKLNTKHVLCHSPRNDLVTPISEMASLLVQFMAIYNLPPRYIRFG